MRKLIIISEEDIHKYDLKKNNLGEVFIWKKYYDERVLLRIIRKYNYLIILGDKYLYETIELLRQEKPFSYFKFDVKYSEGKMFKKYSLRNNLGKYFKALANKRAK